MKRIAGDETINRPIQSSRNDIDRTNRDAITENTRRRRIEDTSAVPIKYPETARASAESEIGCRSCRCGCINYAEQRDRHDATDEQSRESQPTDSKWCRVQHVDLSKKLCKR